MVALILKVNLEFNLLRVGWRIVLSQGFCIPAHDQRALSPIPDLGWLELGFASNNSSAKSKEEVRV